MKMELAEDKKLVIEAVRDVMKEGEGTVKVVIADHKIITITKEIRVYTRKNPAKRRRKP